MNAATVIDLTELEAYMKRIPTQSRDELLMLYTEVQQLKKIIAQLKAENEILTNGSLGYL